MDMDNRASEIRELEEKLEKLREEIEETRLENNVLEQNVRRVYDIGESDLKKTVEYHETHSSSPRKLLTKWILLFLAGTVLGTLLFWIYALLGRY